MTRTLPLAIPDGDAPAAVHRAGDYWCDAAAHLIDGRMVWLGGRATADPVAALVWVGQRAGHVAEQLAPPLARPVWAWRDDADEHAWALEQLAAGKSYALVVCEEDVSYVLAVTPDFRKGEPCESA